MTRALALITAFALTAAPALAFAETGVIFRGASGEAGRAMLSEGPQGVVVRLQLTGLTPGWHAIHFHAVGDCSDAKFDKAGGHINHADAKRPHGLLNPAGPDFGDLPNIFVGADGAAMAEVYSPLVSLKGAGGRPALLDADGSAMVIHAGADDHASQPIGGAGPRVACGVIN